MQIRSQAAKLQPKYCLVWYHVLTCSITYVHYSICMNFHVCALAVIGSSIELDMLVNPVHMSRYKPLAGSTYVHICMYMQLFLMIHAVFVWLLHIINIFFWINSARLDGRSRRQLEHLLLCCQLKCLGAFGYQWSSSRRQSNINCEQYRNSNWSNWLPLLGKQPANQIQAQNSAQMCWMDLIITKQ